MKFIYKNSKDKWIQVSKSYGNGGWVSFYRRGTFGCLLGSKRLVFRRLSSNRRIFGVVPVDLLVSKEDISINQCVCPIHLGGTKVKIKGGFKEEDYEVYCEVGEIKG